MAAVTRAALPDRRPNETVDLEWHLGDGKVVAYSVTMGFDPAGRVREAFLDGNKIGSDAEALIDDACVLLSFCLQRGETVGGLAETLGWEAAGRDGRHASVLGLLCARAAEIEAERLAAVTGAALACTCTRDEDDETSEIHESPSSRGVNAGAEACQPDVADGNPASSPLRIEVERPVDGERRRHEGQPTAAGAAPADPAATPVPAGPSADAGDPLAIPAFLRRPRPSETPPSIRPSGPLGTSLDTAAGAATRDEVGE